MHRYVITGLKVASELAIPEATAWPAASGCDPDVTITVCERPPLIDDPRHTSQWIEVGTNEFVLRPLEGLAFLIRNGREINVWRKPEIADSDLHLFLVGSAWGVLCYQRCLLPLHCSAIVLDGGAIAFAGDSGIGKSTLAAGLAQRGYAVLCDDVGIIEPVAGRVRLLPAPKRVKLRRDAADALALKRGEVVGRRILQDKFYVLVSEYRGKVPIDMSGLYVLSDEEIIEPWIATLEGSEKFEAIWTNLYRQTWLGLTRDPTETFKEVADVARSLQVFRFSRPRDMTRFDRGLDVLESHMRQLPEFKP